MAGSTYGDIFKLSTGGESHGAARGVVVDGCPAGLELTEADVQAFLNRRRPGFSEFSTPRKESDQVEILSGIFEGKTTGTPIAMLVRNTNERSGDYGDIATYYRPGHADYTFDAKYGFRDYRGGGRSSGRETIGRVAAGAIAAKLLGKLGVTFTTYVESIGEVACDPANFDKSYISKNDLNMPDEAAYAKAKEYLQGIMAENDSIGSCVKCIATGVPAGIGDPVFDKLDAKLAGAIMSIGAVKAIEVGDGTKVSAIKGSKDNDGFAVTNGVAAKTSNHAGGILGGISDGSDIILTAHFKATPSIASTQSTMNKAGENININIKGRHDPIIGPRAAVVVESMAAITILDAMMKNMTAKVESLTEFYK